MLAFLLRRLLFAAGTLILTAFFAYGTMRALRPEQYPGQATVPDLFSDVDRALLHLDFGGACMFAGCPSIKRLWLDGIVVDLTLLAGGVAFAVAFGVLGGLWCASRRRTRSARALEGVATVLYCAPVYVVGLGVLLLFAPPFGLVELPYFFDPGSYAPPLENPWDFVRSMMLPWIVVGAPLGAAILRLTLALAVEALGEDYVRTAAAKGVPHAKVVRRHAGPPTYVSVASLVERLGAVHDHEHGPGRVRVRDPGLLPAHEARARPGAQLAAPQGPAHRHPDAAGARAVGGGADRRARTARRPRDRAARPAHPQQRAHDRLMLTFLAPEATVCGAPDMPGESMTADVRSGPWAGSPVSAASSFAPAIPKRWRSGTRSGLG